ncbi:MAG: hypothetical protein ABI868_17245 [Acidobacteriota bacterium]
MDPTALRQVAFPPDNVNQILDVVTWALVAFGIVWLVTSVIGAMHRRAYNLTHAESGRSRKIQPDFLKVDKGKREAAVARGAQYDEQLARREAASPVATATLWSRIAASASALIGVVFTTVTTIQRVGATDEAVRDLGNWEKLKTIVSQHQLGAVLCVAVIASNIYIVVRKLQKSGGD